MCIEVYINRICEYINSRAFIVFTKICISPNSDSRRTVNKINTLSLIDLKSSIYDYPESKIDILLNGIFCIEKIIVF